MSKRQDPFRQPEGDTNTPVTPNLYESLRVAEARTRNRDWEKEHNSHKVVYRGVDPRMATRVKQIAREIQVPEGEVARFLLTYALRAYAQGELELVPRPSPHRSHMTLFPVEDTPQRANLSYTPRKNNNRNSNPASWKRITTWRNFPPQLKSEIVDLASDAGLCVPIGELVTALLRFSLKAYEYGLLVLEPVEKVKGFHLDDGGNE